MSKEGFYMKKIKSIFAFLMFGSLTLSGCAFLDFFKKKDNSSDTPADTSGGDGDSGEQTEEKYTVSFNANGGTGSMDAIPEVKGEYTLPANGFVAPNGKHFSGWKVNNQGELKQPGAKINVSANVVLYAQWENDAPATYTVTFDVQGHGTAPTSVQVTAGGKVTKPTDPSADGWTFDGWYKEAACTNEWDFDNDVVNSATTLFAKWTENGSSLVSVTFDLQGHGENFHVSVQPGETVSKPSSDPADEGYTFAGWYKEAGCETPWDFVNDTISEDTVIYAKWLHTAPYIQHGSGTSWTYVTLTEDSTDPSQYKVTLTLAENEEFVICVDNTSQEQDWRHWEQRGESGVAAEVVQGSENQDGSHNFKVNAEGTYDIFIKKDKTADEGHNVFVTKQVEVFIPLLHHGDPAEFAHEEFVEDQSVANQYKLENIHLDVDDQFVIQVGEGDSDWRHFDDMNTEFSNAAGALEKVVADGNFKVTDAGTFSFYVRTVADTAGKYVYINYVSDNPVEPTAVLKLTHGSETQNIELSVKNETEYYKTGVQIAEGDKFEFVIDDVTYGYSALKLTDGGIPDVFIAEELTGKLICREGHTFDLYCETSTELAPGAKRIYISAQETFIRYSNEAHTESHVVNGVYDEVEHQYFFNDVVLEHDARFAFYHGNGYTTALESIEAASPVKSWIIEDSGVLLMRMAGSYDIYYKDAGTVYIDGTPTIDGSYYIKNDGQPQLLSLKPGAHDEYLVTLDLEVGNTLKLHDGILNDFCTTIKNKTNSAADLSWYNERFTDSEGLITCTKTGSYNFYLKFLGDDFGIWISENGDTVVDKNYIFTNSNSWTIGAGEAKFYCWAWTETENNQDPKQGHWYLMEYDGSDGEKLRVALPSDVIGVVILRLDPSGTMPSNNESHTYGYNDSAVWDKTNDIAVGGLFLDINFEFPPKG